MKVKNSIDISASLEIVWKYTIDVEKWTDWNPAIISIFKEECGELEKGSSVKISQKGMPPCYWVVQNLEEGKLFSWKTKMLGMSMLATHKISVIDDRVRNELSLEVDGFAGRLLWPVLKSLMLKALVEENRNLKRYCEEKKQ